MYRQCRQLLARALKADIPFVVLSAGSPDLASARKVAKYLDTGRLWCAVDGVLARDHC